MNIDTGSFEALTDHVATLEDEVGVLIGTIEWLTRQPAPEEPFELQLIKGGRA